ncbi:MAG: hypothetical protein D6160_20440 [Ketobacter sp.]|nr:MAG: hypothetical protein D6160_20440 [Ketobacter sp.]
MAQVGNFKTRFGGGLVMLFTVVAVGCGQSDVDILASKVEQQKRTIQADISALQHRVDVLDGHQGMRFVVTDFQVAIEDQMFQPVLSASANINVQGLQLPETLYVDVMLQVEVEKENFKSTARQIYPVTRAGADVVMRQALPAHGLTREQIKITLQPVNWYAGQLIADTQVEYQ